jgi:lysophospholipase L1-like esterase
MRLVSRFFQVVMALAMAAVAAATVQTARAQRAAPQPACAGPAELLRLANPLRRTGQRLSVGGPLTIVAIGSSSTSGAGASTPALSYPSRLEAELAAMFPHLSIKVVNRGVNGETAPEMLARFNRDVFAENPDLVLWQVGSNSVLRDQPVRQASATLRTGLERLRAADTDVILINPQYAPKVIAKRDAKLMVQLINATASETNVDLFPRFALMRHWRLVEGIPFSAFLSQDELHLNDWSYGCIAKLLAASIREAATRSTVTATARGGDW